MGANTFGSKHPMSISNCFRAAGLAAALLVAAPSFAGEEFTPEAVIRFVDRAADFYKTNGRDKTLAELNTRNGRFQKGDVYVFAYGLDGSVIAHPINPKLIGKNLLDVPDVDGKFFRREILQTATTQGSGWVDYRYRNSENGKTEPKTTYVRKVDDIILACGIYKH
jgi:cytochrome c